MASPDVDPEGDPEAESRTPDTDPFRPPKQSCQVACLHCGQRYDSYQIHWVAEAGPDGKETGFWCCPIPGCDGKGFLFDIHPIDPNWEDDEDRGMTGGWFDDDGNPVPPPGVF